MSCPARLMFIRRIRGIEFFWRDKIFAKQKVSGKPRLFVLRVVDDVRTKI